MRFTNTHASLIALSLAITPLYGHPVQNDPESTAPGAAKWVREGLIGLGPRQEHSVAAINNTIYVVGGVTFDDANALVTTARVESFDTEQSRWSVPAPLPQFINHVNLASVEDRLYSFGGLTGSSTDDPIWLAVPECNRYEPHTDTWTPIAPMPGQARGSSAMGVHGAKVYVAGGMSRLEATANGTQDALVDVSCYDTATDTWSEDYPPLPDARQHAGGAVVNGVMYVLGGRKEVDHHYDTVFALPLDQPDADGWQERALMPTSRGGLACSALRDRYIVCAGGEGNPDSPLGVFAEVEMYDTVLDEWTSLPPMDVPRHGTAAVTVSDRVYVPGGGIASGGSGGTGGVFDHLLFDGL
jgi:N-acetylneuraminic acid mutarotase